MRNSREFGDLVQELIPISNRDAEGLYDISHTYIGDMKLGRIPSRRMLERLVAALQPPPDVVSRLYQFAGYIPPSERNTSAASPPTKNGARTAPDLSQLSIGQHESPRERLDRRVREASGVLILAGFTVPPLAQGSHGGKFADNDAADSVYLSWLEDVEELNGGRKVPDELREES